MKTILFLSTALLLADDVKDPEISTDQQLEYVHALLEQSQAQAHLTAAIQSMQKTCGERPIITDQRGNPICAPKDSK